MTPLKLWDQSLLAHKYYKQPVMGCNCKQCQDLRQPKKVKKNKTKRNGTNNV